MLNALIKRIKHGEFSVGDRLPGELLLSEEYQVSRGTLREALTELKRSNYITTQPGIGSIVVYDGVSLNDQRGWAQALAESGIGIETEVISITRESHPEYVERYAIEDFICIVRRRCTTTGHHVSLESALIPANHGLDTLPDTGLTNNSLTATLKQHGYVGHSGSQRINIKAIQEDVASLLGKEAGIAFLHVVRETFDSDNRFVERVESFLDPEHFQLHLEFNNS